MITHPLGRPIRLAVLISGGGTTLRNLLEKIAGGELEAEIRHVVSSSSKAGGLQFAAEANLPQTVVKRAQFASAEEFSDRIFAICEDCQADLIVCAGFLKLLAVPSQWEYRVLNIHPALLPAFGGQGYYGLRVHKAALDYGVKISGCTVHFIDQEYDRGPILAQRAVEVLDDDTPESLAARVFAEECELYPQVIRWLAEGRVRMEDRRVRILPPV